MQHIKPTLADEDLAAFVTRPCHASVGSYPSDQVAVVEAMRAKALSHPKPNKSDAANLEGALCRIHSFVLAG